MTEPVVYEHEDDPDAETLAILSDPAALAEIREADAAYQRGDVVRGVANVDALRG